MGRGHSGNSALIAPWRFERATRRLLAAAHSRVTHGSYEALHDEEVSTTFADTRAAVGPFTALGLSCMGCFAICLPLTVLLPSSSLRFARKLSSLALTAVVSENVQHHDMLQNYARCILNADADIPVPDDRWILCGFQSKNPWTDFRGAGLLALRCLNRFATKHPHKLQKIAQSLQVRRHDASEVTTGGLTDISHSPAVAGQRATNGLNSPHVFMSQTQYYPFTACFINVVFLVYQYLRLADELCPQGSSSSSSGKFASASSRHHGSKVNVLRLLRRLQVIDEGHDTSEFEDLVIHCCLALHKKWLRAS